MQPSLKSMKQSSVKIPRLAVGLRMTDFGEMLLDFKIFASPLERVVRKLLVVVQDNNLGYSKTVNNMLLEELVNSLVNDLCQRLGLHPFSKIINRHY